MKIISFIHRGILNNQILDSIFNPKLTEFDVEKIVINTLDLTDKRLLNKVLSLQKTFPEIDFIVKELFREDFLGGMLSTLQLFEQGDILLIDMDCELRNIDISKFFSYYDAVGVSRKVRCGYTYTFDTDGGDEVVNIHIGVRGSNIFAGVAKLGSGLIETLRRLLILYYNPEYIKFENLITSYLRRGGTIKIVAVD